MASIDKAAIGFTIAIVAIALGFVAISDSAQSNPPAASIPKAPAPVAPAEEPETQTDPFAELASEVKEESEVEEMEAEVEEMEAEVEEMEAEVEEMEAEVEEMEEPSGPQTVSVDMPTGTSVPGCEETNECYIPASVTINTGDTVEWINSDTAAHTVTGGSPADGPSGVFDSSLVLGGATYAFTFEEAGSYDYFCMVHPWMVGNVQVN
ncbi:MAG: plastocyanin/azurin family copper-binding protein [Nitrosopumilus sp.]|nr:plastocyanin/azurin family copper-binding protein [Nitrosopumilus sp.]